MQAMINEILETEDGAGRVEEGRGGGQRPQGQLERQQVTGDKGKRQSSAASQDARGKQRKTRQGAEWRRRKRRSKCQASGF